MADLGSIARCGDSAVAGPQAPVVLTASYRYGTSTVSLTADNQGQLTGIVTEAGVAIGDVRVLLYDRGNGQLIRTTRSAADGTFGFSGLDRSSNDYFVLSLDPDGGTQYNAVVFDRLTPG